MAYIDNRYRNLSGYVDYKAFCSGNDFAKVIMKIRNKSEFYDQMASVIGLPFDQTAISKDAHKTLMLVNVNYATALMLTKESDEEIKSVYREVKSVMEEWMNNSREWNLIYDMKNKSIKDEKIYSLYRTEIKKFLNGVESRMMKVRALTPEQRNQILEEMRSVYAKYSNMKIAGSERIALRNEFGPVINRAVLGNENQGQQE